MKTFCTKCERHNSLKVVSKFFEEDGINVKVYYECKECKHYFAEIEKISNKTGQEKFFIKPDLWWETKKDADTNDFVERYTNKQADIDIYDNFWN